MQATWQAVIVLPKGSGDFHGIELVEVIWKTVSVILGNRLGKAIEFHDVLLGFRANRRTGTASLEAKLFQQPATMREEVF